MTLVNLAAAETINVLGPTIQFVTPPDLCGDGPCVMRGSIPAGGIVPLHSHRDPETFYILSGRAEVLEYSDEGFAWLPVGAGDLVHIAGFAKHAFRNGGSDPAVMLITSTERIGAFFREIATPGATWPPSAEALQRFLETSERYGYWNATPAENAEVGLTL